MIPACSAKLPGNVIAMLWMAGFAVGNTVMSAIVKHITQQLPLLVVVFWNLTFTLVVLALPILLDWRAMVVTRRLGLHFLRSVFGVGGLATYTYGLHKLVLADAVALVFTRPLWMIVIAIVLLRERVGWRRGLATVAGFLGVVIMVRPEGRLDPAMLVVLGTAIMTCFILVTMKKLATTEPALRVAFYYAVFGILFTLPFALAEWVVPTPAQFLWLLASAVSALTAGYCTSRACEVGEASVIAPMDFAQLPVAAAIGFVVFSELPGPGSAIGATIILSAGLYIAYREAQLRSPLPPNRMQ